MYGAAWSPLILFSKVPGCFWSIAQNLDSGSTPSGAVIGVAP